MQIHIGIGYFRHMAYPFRSFLSQSSCLSSTRRASRLFGFSHHMEEIPILQTSSERWDNTFHFNQFHTASWKEWPDYNVGLSFHSSLTPPQSSLSLMLSGTIQWRLPEASPSENDRARSQMSKWTSWTMHHFPGHSPHCEKKTLTLHKNKNRSQICFLSDVFRPCRNDCSYFLQRLDRRSIKSWSVPRCI